MARFDTPEVTIEQRVLEPIKVAAAAKLSAAVIHDLKFETAVEMMTNEMVMRLSSRIYGEQLDSETFERTVRWLEPRSRRDHLKLALYDSRGRIDRWLMRRYPVLWNEQERTLRVEVKRWATFPDQQRIYPPELGRVVYQQIAHPVYGESEREG
jgi:hypothetical protein